MLGLSKGQRDLFVASTVLKVLFYPAYRSTDFEVHRNWLAITHQLPLKQWYYDTTSEWTLDYPPFFACFSYLLTLPARLLPRSAQDHLLQLSPTPVDSWLITGYMRTTVLVSELVLLLGLQRGSEAQSIISFGLLLHPGFLILDSIHFQYNGFLFGILVWSLVGAKEGRPIMCAGFFAALLNFKHIYMYLAPAWFIYLFRAYCYILHLRPLAQIGFVTVLVSAMSLGPFLALGQGPQLLSRLFPFTRGLNHAYWAPNAWADITLVDRVLYQASRRFGLDMSVSAAGIKSSSRGLVGDTNFAVLPDIKPFHCFVITLVIQCISLISLWLKPTYRSFLQSITACGFASFMFGWHVHEKAVMLLLVPLSLMSTDDWNHYQAFKVASVSGLVSLFPLLFHAAETPIKMGYTFIWLVIVLSSLRQSVSKTPPSISSYLADNIQSLYLYTALPLLLFTSIIHPYLTLTGAVIHAEFLPLMTTSIWCSTGMWIAWGRVLVGLFTGHSKRTI
ncbi:glycosyl transferase [Kockovaella imperatae]|uniref:Alpha-1,3-glucosyltransferase n=1 Tax=Kockovaella imperatae TaxID=4999 RepID=A0A1Y1U7C0_9TREE|nr:glycosyl transferase [Kockovaella imperatae]ORX33434.1 glycosyl transferase [Kockovaella imperatae]